MKGWFVYVAYFRVCENVFNERLWIFNLVIFPHRDGQNEREVCGRDGERERGW